MIAGLAFAMATVDFRGPIENEGMKVEVSAGRVEAPAYNFDPRASQKPGPWGGSWIWLQDDSRPVMGMFRKTVFLPATPVGVRVWMSADTSYRLYVNGRLASRGPADIGTDYPGGEAISTGHWLYDSRDLTPYFHSGQNQIAVEVFTQPLAGSPVSKGRPGLLFEAQARFARHTSEVFTSDSSWRGMAGQQMSRGPGGWQWDARKDPASWRGPGFDDSGWARCRPLESVWTPLDASEIPPCMEARYPAAGPHSGTLNAGEQMTVKFDRVMSGFVTIAANGPAGARLEVVPNETSDRPSRRMRLVLGAGRTLFEYPFLDGFSSITVKAVEASGPVTIEDLGSVFSSQPVAYRGSFSCSDPHLDELWKVSRWITQICLQTHHLDSPNHLEPISDPGDYLIEDLVAANAFGEPWLARQDLRKFRQILVRRQNHNFHTSYSLLWLHTLLDYYDHTGDKALLAELQPTVESLLRTFTGYLGSNGIVSEAPNYMFMDWVTIEGFECHHPPAVIGQGYMTALFVQALQDGARIREVLGQPSGDLSQLHGRVRDAFNRELWDSGKGLYRDGKPGQTHVPPGQWLPADKLIETFSTQVNTLAVLCGLVPPERAGGVLDRVMERPDLNCQPYFMHFVFGALAKAGRFERYGLDQIRRWKIVPETQSFREMWHDGDYCHGWGATPLVQLSTQVLGVTPAAPGFAAVAIRPLPCGLTWAKGSVPTPHGPILIEWKIADGRFTINVALPTAMPADVFLPGSLEPQHVVGGQHRFQSPG